MSTHLRLRTLSAGMLLAAMLLLPGCTHLAIEDCGGEVLGQNKARIRSSHFRMLLKDVGAAAGRFAPYAAMSALAYAQDADCGTGEPKVKAEPREVLEKYLATLGWREVGAAPGVPPCETDTGLFFRVYEHAEPTAEVVLAFRGTWGWKDWIFGNLHGLTRFLPIKDQYLEAREMAAAVFEKYAQPGQLPVRFVATGHSLGGGLAQHVLYAHPRIVSQVIAFDPSSVTGFTDQAPEDQVAACECLPGLAPAEARIYRVYDAYEILANLRIFHKVFFPPERHIQEVRFPNAASHSMLGLANYLKQHATSPTSPKSAWYAGEGQLSAAESCTHAFVRRQQASCDVKVDSNAWFKCPQ